MTTTRPLVPALFQFVDGRFSFVLDTTALSISTIETREEVKTFVADVNQNSYNSIQEILQQATRLVAAMRECEGDAIDSGTDMTTKSAEVESADPLPEGKGKGPRPPPAGKGQSLQPPSPIVSFLPPCAPPTTDHAAQFARSNYGMQIEAFVCEAVSRGDFDTRRAQRQKEWEARFGIGTVFSYDVLSANPDFEFSDGRGIWRIS